MACGLPVISTNMCLGAVELIENGINGYIVPVNNSNELTEAMKKLLCVDSSVIGIVNLQKITNYTYENVIKSHIQAINELVKNEIIKGMSRDELK